MVSHKLIWEKLIRPCFKHSNQVPLYKAFSRKITPGHILYILVRRNVYNVTQKELSFKLFFFYFNKNL